MTFKHKDATDTGIDIAKGRVDALDTQIIRDALACKNGPKTFADIGSGESRLSAIMALLSWRVYTYDKRDLRKYFATLNKFIGNGRVEYSQTDLRNELPKLPSQLRIAVLQRSLHYLPYKRAKELLVEIYNHLIKNGKLYMTVSSTESAFADNYECANKILEERFCKLSGNQAREHSVNELICLYAKDELQTLIKSIGFEIEKMEMTQFGNIRIIASKH